MRGFASARRYTYSDARLLLMGLGLAIAFILAAVGTGRREAGPAHGDAAGRDADLRQLETEYDVLRSEAALARSGEIYMVMDPAGGGLSLRLGTAVVWDCPLEVEAADSAAARGFLSAFAGGLGCPGRLLTSKYMHRWAGAIPDSVLAVVARAVNADPALLQRELPAGFHLRWGHLLRLEVRTDIPGEHGSTAANFAMFVDEALSRAAGEKTMVVHMDARRALTLYRAARPGMPVLLVSGLE
jgi:hypothetical protein